MHFQVVGEQVDVDVIALEVIVPVRHRVDQQLAHRFQRVFGGLLVREPQQPHHAVHMVAQEGLCLAQLVWQRAVDLLLDETIRQAISHETRRQDTGIRQPLLGVFPKKQQRGIGWDQPGWVDSLPGTGAVLAQAQAAAPQEHLFGGFLSRQVQQPDISRHLLGVQVVQRGVQGNFRLEIQHASFH